MSQVAAAIGVLRVRSSASEPASTRLCLERQLGGVDPTPPGLPPSALLIVRRLADPLPGHLGGEPRRPVAPPAWSAALRERLADVAASAERPSSGRLSAAAEAVLFADAAELAACLVLELARGVARQHWWWQRVAIVLPSLGLPAVGAVNDMEPARVLVSFARDMPAVFARLVDWKAAAEIASAMDKGQTRRLLEALARAHGLDARVIGRGPTTEDSARLDWPATRDSSPAPGAARPQEATPPTSRDLGPAVASGEPWLPWLPADTAAQSLSAAQRCLVGLALMLHQAPAAARAASFAWQADAWWRREVEGSSRGAGAGEPARTAHSIRTGAGLGSAVPDLSAGWTGQRGATRPRSGLAGMDGPGRERGPVRAALANPRASPAGLTEVAALPSNRLGSGSPPREQCAATPANPLFSERGGAVGTPSRAQEGAAPRPETGRGGPTVGSEPADLPAPAPAGDEQSHWVGDLSAARLQPASAGGHSAAPDAVNASAAAGGEKRSAGPAPSPRVFSGQQVTTRLGGVLYLIHALEELEIPDAFEADWQLASRAGPWGALDLIARLLLGDRFAAHADDPLWSVLAALTPDISAAVSAAEPWTDPCGDTARAHREALDNSLAPAWPATVPDYCAPVRWRTALADAEPCMRWTESGGRLWLWSERGFVTASVVRDGRHPMEQAQAEATAWAGASAWQLRPGRLADVPLTIHGASGSRRGFGCWAAAAAPAVQRRLRLALDVEPGDADPIERLLSVPGGLYLTTSHVDLVTDLDQIWLPARRAGLDRDPGWLPDYGRVVLFHFR